VTPAHRIGLGCWRLSGPGRPDRETALATIGAAYDAGYRVFDTADSYCLSEDEHGHGERLVAEALAGRPDAVLVTKGGWARPNGVWEHRGSPEWLRRAIGESVERLGRPADVYLLHAPDPDVALEDSMAELFRARDEGLIGAVGVSNVSTAELERLLAEGPVEVVQNRLSVTVRPAGTGELLALCEQRSLTFMAYSPLGPTLDEGAQARVADDAAVRAIAARHRASPQAVALAWLLERGPHVMPIPGARRAESARDSLTALDLALDADDLKLLDAARREA
jgi:aryl-alcohol dehydrogenase-like predicted oxidoreductase